MNELTTEITAELKKFMDSILGLSHDEQRTQLMDFLSRNKLTIHDLHWGRPSEETQLRMNNALALEQSLRASLHPSGVPAVHEVTHPHETGSSEG